MDNAPTMTDAEVQKKLEELPAPRVTKADIEARIVDVHYLYPLSATTVTICNISLDNGYSVRGESACVDPRNFDVELGKKLSYEQAMNRLWPLFGFLLAEERYRRTVKVPAWITEKQD